MSPSLTSNAADLKSLVATRLLRARRRLMVELSHRFRTQPITVLNRGVSAERAADMLARFDDSVATERPDLVLWQVGTNAVLQGYEHSKSDALIRDGIRRMKATGADVVLIDPQFAPKVIAKPEIEDMVDLISSAAKQENVDVFHHFASCGTGTKSMACPSRYSFRRTGCI
jgi:acyl-CoA thioesterase-1